MAVRSMLIGQLLQIPVAWTAYDGMVHLDCRYIGPLAGFILREANTYWAEATVSNFLRVLRNKIGRDGRIGLE